MFSGIIEEIGKIKQIEKMQGGLRLVISAKLITNDLKLGDSVSVDGVCLTVNSFNSHSFTADAVGETLKKSTIRDIRKETFINLERAIKYNQRVGGHLVQGHVNLVAKILQIKKLGENYSLEIELPENIIKYVIKEGSIAIDGISLTIAEVINNRIIISVIPHTWQHTTLQYKNKEDRVNIEVDFIAKYIENFMKINSNKNININEDTLRSLGY